jgi:hypothetical protein
MKQAHFWFSWLILALTGSAALARDGRCPLTDARVPEGLGVNIHFTDPRPGEMDMLAAGGFRWVRMDFHWAATERVPGQYDFSRYDTLMKALAPHGIRALLILDYSNKHYDQGLSPHSDEGRRAFARWAAAAVTHFRGRGILWEMYNEPNISFWKPKPNVEDYAKLALAVGRAIRAAAADEMYIGPGTSQIDMAFLESCFQAGLLEYWCGVSVHPYRQKGPETADAEYAALRRLIRRYAPAGKNIPILSGEWGYSAAWHNFDPDKQGRMLPRQWLVNLANQVPVSIWYDWHDDGLDPKEPEHHFGTVLHPYHADRTPVYEPKPAYLAAKTLTTLLAGFQFNKRLSVAGPEEHVFLFAKGDQVRLAAWTSASETREVIVPASPGRFAVTGHTGDRLPPQTAGVQGLKLTLTDAPQYLVPEQPNDLLRLAAAWEPAPLEIYQPAGKLSLSLGLVNPLTRPIRVLMPGGPTVEVAPGAQLAVSSRDVLLRDPEPKPFEVKLAVEGFAPLVQRTVAQASNPLAVEFGPLDTDALAVRVENASGEPLAGTLRLADVQGLAARVETPLAIPQGQLQTTLRIPLSRPAEQRFRFGARVEDGQRRLQLLVPAQEYAPIDDFARYTSDALAKAYHLTADGDRRVSSRQSLSLSAPPVGLPVQPKQCLKLAYQLDSGWKFLQLKPVTAEQRKIDGRPKSLVVWLYNDGPALSPRLRFVDATGQTFQPSGELVKPKGWRCVVIPMQGPQFGHWGGANDGVVHEPIHWDSLLLLDKTKRDTACQGEVYVTAPVLVY